MPTSSAPLDMETARQVFNDEVYNPVWLEQLSARGFAPTTPEEFTLMQKMSADLRQAHQTKIAAAGGIRPWLRKSAEALNGKTAAGQGAAPIVSRDRVKSAAAELARTTPALAHAYLSMLHHHNASQQPAA